MKTKQSENPWGLPPKEHKSVKGILPPKSKPRTMTLKLNYNAAGLDVSDLLMESIASRGGIREEWDTDKWSSVFHSLGQIPASTLAGDVDRWHQFIYAAELLRKAGPEARDSRIADRGHINPNFDMDEYQPKISGTMWGGVEKDYGTVRGQMASGKQKVIDDNKPKLNPAQVAKESENLALEERWAAAESLAARAPRNGEHGWEGKLDWEFEQMVKYCYSWLRDVSAVPKPYPMELTDLFWPRPKSDDAEVLFLERRQSIVEKVIAFWRKSVAADPPGLDLTSKSYRVILAAMSLEKAIERYASNHRRYHTSSEPGTGVILDVPDAEAAKEVRATALIYFQAHFPVQLDGAKPGPIDTLDPPYVEYVRLCRKYNIEQGTILHTVDL